jgi:hypothetical protein
MADQIRDIYRVASLSKLELNNIFARISDRMDRIEGLRGIPEFYTDTFSFPREQLTAGHVLRVISTGEMRVSQVNVSELAGMTSGSFIKGDADGTPVERTPAEVVSDLGLEIGADVQAWSSILDNLAGNQISGDTLVGIYDVNGEIIHQYPLEWLMYGSEVFRIVGDDLDLTPEA